jgi:hypothetical protein
VKSSRRSQPPQSIRRLVPASSERIPLAQAPGGRRFPATVKMDLKIAVVITAIGLGVPPGSLGEAVQIGSRDVVHLPDRQEEK